MVEGCEGMVSNVYLSAAITMLEAASALNSGSQLCRKASRSFIIWRTLLAFTSANESSIARLQTSAL